MGSKIYLASCFGAALIACVSTVYSNVILEETIDKSVSQALLQSNQDMLLAFEQSKPKTHQERLMKSSRVFEHTIYLADKFYNGDLMADSLVSYTNQAYSAIMSNLYSSKFYLKLNELNRSDLAIKTYTDAYGDKVFTDDISQVTGAVIQGKYNLDLAQGSIFTEVIASGGIDASYLYMVNDFVPHPTCDKGSVPVVVFGELYPDGSQPYGALTEPEEKGWRVGFKDISPLSEAALQNRIMLQTACRFIGQEEQVEMTD
jgi:hypothetical protein